MSLPTFRTLVFHEEYLTHEWLLVWIGFGSLILGVISLGVAWMLFSKTADSIRSQTLNSRMEKMADAVLECDRRFQQISALAFTFEIDSHSASSRALNKVSESRKTIQAARSFWALQYEQWEYFRDGLIAGHHFRTWMGATIDSFRPNAEIRLVGKTFSQSWDIHKNSYSHVPKFQSFISAMRDAGLNDESTSQSLDVLYQEQKTAAKEHYARFRKELEAEIG